MPGKPDTEAHKTVQSTEQIGEGPTALPATQGILQELLPAGEAQQAVEILEESLHVTGGAQLPAETKSQNTTENSEAHPIPETEAASTSEAAAKTTDANEAYTIPGTVLETPEEAESLQSLVETTELKAKKRGQDPQIPANITEDQEGGERAAISKEEILKASEQEISVDAESELQQYTEQDPAASLGASCELPQTLEPRSKTQAFQPLQSIVTAVDERGVQGEPKQSLSASETQGRKGEMALHSDCGPLGSEAVPSKEIFAREPLSPAEEKLDPSNGGSPKQTNRVPLPLTNALRLL
uniref:Uncharacterized protein n=1 Tax=Terrapene triunguis TaxID=2587831 RepID=A0A674IHP8_9SAUR